MERVAKFLKDAETYYLATVEGDQPRVRPFGTAQMHTLHYRRCIPQMMVIRRYFILRMPQQRSHHLHMNRKL